MNKGLLKRLLEIRKEMLTNSNHFYNIPMNQRNQPWVDNIRGNLTKLTEDAESLLPKPVLPAGLHFGLPIKNEIVYGVRILPSENASIRSWGKIVRFGDVKKYGLEWRGDFLHPVGSPSNLRFIVMRTFLSGKCGLQNLAERIFD